MHRSRRLTRDTLSRALLRNDQQLSRGRRVWGAWREAERVGETGSARELPPGPAQTTRLLLPRGGYRGGDPIPFFAPSHALGSAQSRCISCVGLLGNVPLINRS